MTRFLTELTCKECGKPMTLVEPDGGFTGGWSEEDERGNTVAIHWARSWCCECGVRAAEGAVEDDPFNDDPDADYLMPDSDPLEWYDQDGESLDDDDVPLPPELQQEGYYVQTEAGNQAHVLVSPGMSEEGWTALNKLIDAAWKSLDEDAIVDESDEGNL